MKTEFEKELEKLVIAYESERDTIFHDLRKAFIAKYDPAKQLQSNVTRIAGAMDAQTVEEGLGTLWVHPPPPSVAIDLERIREITKVAMEKSKKTTQFDTLINPTHIVHPLGFEFAVKDAIQTMPNDYIWEINGKTIARYHAFDGGRLIFKNPFSSEYLRGFDIEKLVLDLPK